MSLIPPDRRWSVLEHAMRCPECSGELTARRSCLQVSLVCQSCARVFSMDQLGSQVEDDFEEDLGWIPVDRL